MSSVIDTALHTAFFDESGSHRGASVLVVAGYVASDRDWAGFDDQWQRTLDAHGVRRFHMREFAHSVGEYATWRGDEQRRSRFLKELIAITARYARLSVAVGVVLRDYDRLDERYELTERTGGPYAFCAMQCLRVLRRANPTWLPPRTLVRPKFEAGHVDASRFAARAAREMNLTVEFWRKDRYLGFQAADLLAWEYLKVNDAIAREQDPYRRKSFQALGRMPQAWQVYWEQPLRSLCRAQGFQERCS